MRYLFNTLALLVVIFSFSVFQSPAHSGETFNLGSKVYDHDGLEAGTLVDILVLPRSEKRLGVLLQPSENNPLVFPLDDLRNDNGRYSLSWTLSALSKFPKDVVIASAGIPSQRFGRLGSNIGFRTVPTVPEEELRFAYTTGPNLGTQQNLKELWMNGIKPFKD